MAFNAAHRFIEPREILVSEAADTLDGQAGYRVAGTFIFDEQRAGLDVVDFAYWWWKTR